MAMHEKITTLQHTLQDAFQGVQDIQASVVELERSAGLTLADPWVMGLTVFALACFVGYYVVWRVTPALHSPLMAVTNAVSSVIIVGAIMAVGPSDQPVGWLGLCGIFLASINIFGGFVVTERMLSMFSRKKA